MNITLDYRNPTPLHCDVAVFLDHALVGVLTLRQEDLLTFQHIILHGIRENRDTFLGTGDPSPPLTLCEYAALQARILELAQLDPAPSSPEGLELLRLTDLVEAFEREHFKFEEPPP